MAAILFIPHKNCARASISTRALFAIEDNLIAKRVKG